MSKREDLKSEFLQLHGWGEAQRSHLAGDASLRSYQRIHRPIIIESVAEEVEPFTAQTIEFAVLMDAPPPEEDIKPFISIARKLNQYGLNTPEIIAHSQSAGFILLEDFGDSSFNRILPSDGTVNICQLAEEIYKRAIDVLVILHNFPVDNDLPHYNDKLLKQELELFTDWYLPLVNKKETSGKFKEKFLNNWDSLFKIVHQLPEVMVLRDYHADNLMWLDSKSGVEQVGLLDFQDAVNGSPAYDLASLLEDARRDVSPEFATKMKEYYLQQCPNLDCEIFKQSYVILAAQRNIKILGIFARLCVRDNKPEYLDYLPRVIKYLKNDLENPILLQISELVNNI